MANEQLAVRLERWRGGQHPTLSTITRLMQQQGLQPYMWSNAANTRHGVQSHGYEKMLYVVEGSVEVTLPDSNQRATLRAGDRIDIPAGVRHGLIVGTSGVRCVEAAVTRQRARRR
ncbi:MAG: hypothetical protein OHK0046_00890 [Anaerolineae bacterium]